MAEGQTPSQSLMIVASSVPAARMTIHFRKFSSVSGFTSSHCKGLQREIELPPKMKESLKLFAIRDVEPARR